MIYPFSLPGNAASTLQSCDIACRFIDVDMSGCQSKLHKSVASWSVLASERSGSSSGGPSSATVI